MLPTDFAVYATHENDAPFVAVLEPSSWRELAADFSLAAYGYPALKVHRAHLVVTANYWFVACLSAGDALLESYYFDDGILEKR